jgi:hypothetical protein
MMRRSQLKRSAAPLRRTRLKARRLDPRDLTWAAAVRDAANGFCQRCGNFGHHSHHVASRKRRPDLRWDVSNGRYLCALCHQYIHEHPLVGLTEGFLSNVAYEAQRCL